MGKVNREVGWGRISVRLNVCNDRKDYIFLKGEIQDDILCGKN